MFTKIFNSEAYWDCLQGTLIFEFHFYYKSIAQSSFQVFVINVPSMLNAALNNFKRSSFLILFHCFESY